MGPDGFSCELCVSATNAVLTVFEGGSRWTKHYRTSQTALEDAETLGLLLSKLQLQEVTNSDSSDKVYGFYTPVQFSPSMLQENGFHKRASE